MRTVLKTIELANYNRKYGDKNRRTKSREESPPLALPTENKLPLPGQHGSEDRSTPTRKSRQPETAIFVENKIGHRNTSVQYGNHNAYMQEDRTLCQCLQK